MATYCVIICAAMLALFACTGSSFIPPRETNETTEVQANVQCSTDLATVKGLNILLLHSIYGPVEHLMKSISASLSRLNFDADSGVCLGVAAISGLLDDAFANCTVEAGILSKLYEATEYNAEALLHEDVAEALDYAAKLLFKRSGPKVIVLAAGFIPDVSTAAFVANQLRDQGIALVGVSMDTGTYLESNPLSQVVSTQEFLHVSDPYLGDDLMDAIALGICKQQQETQ